MLVASALQMNFLLSVEDFHFNLYNFTHKFYSNILKHSPTIYFILVKSRVEKKQH